MNIIDLPDDILVLLFDKYLRLPDLNALSLTCTRFSQIIATFNLWSKYLRVYPVLDFSHPNGFNEQFLISKRSQEKFQSGTRIKKYLNLVDKKIHSKIFYHYQEKMIPHIQIDDESNDLFGYPTLFASDANRLCCLNVDEIGKFSSKHRNVRAVKRIKIFYNNDVKGFIKKSNLAACFSENSLIIYKLGKSNDNSSYDFKFFEGIREFKARINCLDFSNKLNKLIYGLSDGTLKIRQINDYSDRSKSTTTNEYEYINVGDRILRCAISPSLRSVAVGSAGVFQLRDQGICPIRIYDLESLKETHLPKPASRTFKLGAGVLALSYIDENLVMTAGYDTFIRIFDLRSNKCVQYLEEPEDMSIYCVCCSKYYGLLSGNDRQSIIRYWDRRKNRVISTYLASNSNSSIYSLHCTPESIYAAWDYGITAIEYA